MTGQVDTKRAERRALSFGGVDDLLRDLEALEASERAGTLRVTGNWTAAQGLEHCARFWAAPIDGFPAGFRPPWFVRVLARVFMKKAALSGGTAPAGMRPPKAFTDHFVPSAETGFAEAIAHLRAQIGRTVAGERFAHESPLLGVLSHDQWLTLQLGHCQLHLGFMHPG